MMRGVLLLLSVIGAFALTGWGDLSASCLPAGRDVDKGKAAELFAPGRISRGLYERDFTASPDGREVFFTIMGPGYSVICQAQRGAGGWGEPEVVSFSGERTWRDAEPCLSPDGGRLFFLSTRTPPGMEPRPGWGHQHIWVVDRNETGWGEPALLGAPIFSEQGEYYPSLTRDQTLYYTRAGEKPRESSIWRARWRNGNYQAPEKLPVQVNAVNTQFNACIAPDESWLVLCAAGHPGQPEGAGFYVSFRLPDDRWSAVLPLAEVLGLPGAQAVAASVTPDGSTLMLSIQVPAQGSGQARITCQELYHPVQEPGNGLSDLYQVPTAVLVPLREKARFEQKER